MAEIDSKLVQEIAQQVMAALQQGGRAPGGSSAQPTPIHPPAGVCTGDYTQFTDRPDLGGSSEPQPSADPPVAAQQAYTQSDTDGSDAEASQLASPVPLTGIITAQQLQDAMAVTPGGVVHLAADARLTPLASDWVRENPTKINRVQKGEAPRPMAVKNKLPAKAQWLWWADGFCPNVQDVTNQHRDVLRMSAETRGETGLTRVMRDLAAAMADGRVDGGMLFVEHSARAMCYLNRCPWIRAVLATSVEGVDEALRSIGANVLVVEYKNVSGATLKNAVEHMLRGKRTISPQAERELAAMQRGDV